MNSQRYEQGLQKLNEVDGQHGMELVRMLTEKVPDLAQYLVEYPFGDIYSRPGLSLRDRELATVAALTALGHAQPQLEVHVRAALNVGLSKEEIMEVILQQSVYAGFPAALNATFTALRVFENA